jgi:hypothetical protein
MIWHKVFNPDSIPRRKIIVIRYRNLAGEIEDDMAFRSSNDPSELICLNSSTRLNDVISWAYLYEELKYDGSIEEDTVSPTINGDEDDGNGSEFTSREITILLAFREFLRNMEIAINPVCNTRQTGGIANSTKDRSI